MTDDENIDDDTIKIDDIIPNANVTPAAEQPIKINEIISDEAILGMFGEILQNNRKDRSEIDEYIASFAEMVLNEGDSTTSSKEALVNLIKTKVEANNSMAKVADLMTRIKLKSDHFPAYLAPDPAKDTSKRDLLKQIERAKRKNNGHN